MAVVSVYDVRDVRRASGTAYHIAESLEAASTTVRRIGPLRPLPDPINAGRYLVNRFLRRQSDHPQRDPAFLRHLARQVGRRLRNADAQVVLGAGGLPIAYLETDLPIVVWTDCTFASLLDYYPRFTNLSARSIRDGHAAEQSMFDRCSLAILTSQWAADSAVKDYGFDPDKIVLIPRGSNLPDDRSRADIQRLLDSKPTDRCRLLFMGVDWKRKGGDVAVEVARTLNRRGIPTDLVVAGCEPRPRGRVPDFVRPAGYLSKATQDGLDRIGRLLAESHFLVLPTRADCTPIVLCEAASFGVPSVTTRTGGIPSVIRDDVNGRMFEPDAPPEVYADYIARTLADRDGYRSLALSAFDEYSTRLNWRESGRRAVESLRKLVNPPQANPGVSGSDSVHHASR